MNVPLQPITSYGKLLSRGLMATNPVISFSLTLKIKAALHGFPHLKIQAGVNVPLQPITSYGKLLSRGLMATNPAISLQIMGRSCKNRS